MKIKSMVKYLMNDFIKGYLGFAGAILLVIHLGMILAVATDGDGMLGGMEFSTIIFMLIIGIISYRENISMSIQNGVSRKTYFISEAIAFVLFALTGSCVDTLYCVLGNAYESIIDGFIYDSTFEQLFMSNGEVPGLTDYLKEFVMQFSFEFMALSVGLLIGAVVYRLNKVMKFVIPAAIYIFGFIVIPFVDYALFDLFITRKLASFMNFVGESFSHMSVTMTISGLVLLAVSYLFIRRVQIADRK